MPIAHSLKEVALDGGVRGLLIDVPGAPVTKFGVSFHTGSTTVTRGWPYQAAHIVEHIAAAYTTDEQYPTPGDLTNDIERGGAYVNATTTANNISYYGYSATDEWQRVAGLLKIPIVAPRFSDETLASERGNVIEELSGYDSDHEQVSWELARKALTADAWLTSRESIEDATEATVTDIEAAYAATHTRGNLRFIVAGDLSRSAVPTGAFDGWPLPGGAPLATGTIRFIRGGAYKYARRRSLTTVANTLFFALDRAPRIVDIETLDVLGYLLFNSQSSRVLGTARERGICYGMSSSVDMRTNEQLSSAVEFSVSPENMAPVIGVIVDELSSILRTGFTDSEIDRAKTYNLGLLRMSGQTAGDLYDAYESDFFKRGRVVPYADIEAAYRTITAESVLALLRELLGGPWALGGTGPGANMEYREHFTALAAFIGTE